MMYERLNRMLYFMSFFFFFQAEDGIRDRDVTGVQTCALPICKIMRRILRKIAENEYGSLGDTSTLADPSVVDDLIDNRQNR